MSAVTMGIDSIDYFIEPIMYELNYLYKIVLQFLDPVDLI